MRRSFDVGGVGFRPTGRKCAECGRPLHDGLLDWEDDLPACVATATTAAYSTLDSRLLSHYTPRYDIELAERHAELSSAPGGVAVCLGTSMQMVPARDFATEAAALVVVNLQPTWGDDKVGLP